MQMSNCAFSQDENLTFKLPFVYLHMQVFTSFDRGWLAAAFDAPVWRHAVFPGRPLGPLVAKNIRGWKPQTLFGIKVLLRPILGCKCAVAQCQPSSPEYKEGFYGSSWHNAAIQGHWTRRKRLLSAVCCCPQNLLHVLLLHLSFAPFIRCRLWRFRPQEQSGKFLNRSRLIRKMGRRQEIGLTSKATVLGNRQAQEPKDKQDHAWVNSQTTWRLSGKQKRQSGTGWGEHTA